MCTLLDRLRRRNRTESITNKELDQILDIIASRRRRRVIEYLHEHTSATLGELAEHIADQEIEGPVTTEDRNRVWTALYQSHLPTLSDAGLVVHEGDSVTATDTLTDVHSATTALARSYRRSRN